MILALLACTEAPPPLVEAHRGAARHWPQNSRTALINSIAADYDVIEFDIVLTSDEVPVISHDPWVHETLCTHADGSAISERVYVKDLTLEQLTTDYLCGGEPDPENPDAETVAEPMMSFEELLLALDENTGIGVHIDVKYEPDGTTLDAQTFADAILSRWDDAALPNPSYASANVPEMTRLLKAGGLRTSLVYPRFPPETNNTTTALREEAKSFLGFNDLVEYAEEGAADSLCMPYQVVDRRQVEFLLDHGIETQVWTLNTPELVDHYMGWPIESIITDEPELAQ